MTPLVDGPVGWLSAHLDWFRPARWERSLPRRAFRAGPLLELLGLCRCLRRVPAEPSAARLDEAALDLGSQIVDSAEFREGLYRCDHLFTYHLYLLGLVHTGGRSRPELVAAATRLVEASAGVRAGALRSVHELVELRYVLDLLGIPAPLPAMHLLLNGSAVGSGVPAAPLTDNEVYALTHLLFYASDFAAEPAPTVAASIPGLIRALIGVYATLADFDLLAELLLCARLLGLHPGGPGARGSERLVAHGWAVLERGRRADGSVPGPLHVPETEARLRGEQQDAYRFGTSYHTTIVAAMATAARDLDRVHPA